MEKTVGMDIVRLGHYLSTHVAGLRCPIEVERFGGGQSNPTFCVTDAKLRKYVLRKKPEGPLLPSAHAIEREYRVMTALQGSGVPVPRTLLLCSDSQVVGTPFFLMEHVAGRIFWDPALPGLGREERGAFTML
jgi:aminoglycoside phosphotransferase (APT) family kinase protein